MEVSQLVWDRDLLTSSYIVLTFIASNFCIIISLLSFSFIHHSLQNQKKIALQVMIAFSVSIVAASTKYCVTIE